MAAKPSKVRFMASKKGKVHVVTTPAADKKNSKCVTVKVNHGQPVATGGWGKRPGISADAALAMDECSKCGTHAVARQVIEESKTPAQKRAERKQEAEDTRRKIANGSKSKSRNKDRVEKAKRRGPKGGDATERMKANVEEHAKLAKDNGWKIKSCGESDTNEWMVEATRNGELLRLIYRDGRTVHSRVTLKSGVEVRLRNSSNWRKHATGESKVKPDYQPRQGKGAGSKKARKAEVIDDAKASKNLPFNIEEDSPETIIESLLGKTITWRRSVDNTLDTAKVPMKARNCRMREHPKSNRLMISFHESQGVGEHGELLGGERTVFVDKIVKAR